MELNESQNRFTDICPTCGIEKVYKSNYNRNKCKGKNCRSCTNSISGGGIGNARPLDGKKRCLDCDIVKDVSLFYTSSKGGVHAVCKECSHVRSSKYHTQHYRYAMYGLTKEEFTKIAESQGYKCKICLSEEKLMIDHCHETNKVRGLICRTCNAAIGLFKENIEIIEKAVEYLKKSKEDE